VLSGAIRRGSGTTIEAALLIADLRGFTTLADTAGLDLIARLDRHLEAMADPVAEQGGEVLKFLGDGLLAAFPITEELSHESACAAAVRAAQAALERNEAVNRLHEVPLALDIALHCGDVYYGNIGAAGRLDFTVIGPAVNEASRMEALCSPLDCSVILSERVASVSPVPVRSLGPHHLRGITQAGRTMPRSMISSTEGKARRAASGMSRAATSSGRALPGPPTMIRPTIPACSCGAQKKS
jgi:adenylate cyclase